MFTKNCTTSAEVYHLISLWASDLKKTCSIEWWRLLNFTWVMLLFFGVLFFVKITEIGHYWWLLLEIRRWSASSQRWASLEIGDFRGVSQTGGSLYNPVPTVWSYEVALMVEKVGDPALHHESHSVAKLWFLQTYPQTAVWQAAWTWLPLAIKNPNILVC